MPVQDTFLPKMHDPTRILLIDGTIPSVVENGSRTAMMMVRMMWIRTTQSCEMLEQSVPWAAHAYVDEGMKYLHLHHLLLHG